MDDQSTSSVFKTLKQFQQRAQFILDKSTPYVVGRWIALLVVILLYTLRVWYLRGFYIITYGLGIYNLNLVLGFITPQADPEFEGPELPTKADEEFRPFIRRLPEFKFWYASINSFLVGILMTFFGIFDIPVFWPILLMYFCILCFITMKRQIQHMIKFRYVPFAWGKKRYKNTEQQKNPKAEADDV